jgi:hypothetical protein
LWRPAEAVNAAVGGFLGWSHEEISRNPIGTWCQEAFIFLLAMAAVLWISRGQAIEPLRRFGGVAMVTAPWLTSAEALVVVLSVGQWRSKGTLVMMMAASALAGIGWWMLADKGSVRPARAVLGLGFLVTLFALYWLNSPATGLFQVIAIAATLFLVWQSARAPAYPPSNQHEMSP